MGPAQALDRVLEAAALLARHRPDIEFCFLGSGIDTERLKVRAQERGLVNVRFLPRVPMAEVDGWLAAADCLLVHLRADPLFAITIPSKTQAYMAAGRPIIMAVQGDAAELVRQSGAGIVVPPEDPVALAEAVKTLAGMERQELGRMGSSGRAFYEKNLSFDRGSRRIADRLHAVRRSLKRDRKPR
jgi:glycosyltransferase involved in cell wall biosynthesis